MKKLAITWTATEAIYGISRDDHCAGVVYKCDCGCDGQGWLIRPFTKKHTSLNIGPFSLTRFQCSHCLKWFVVCTFLFTTAWFKRSYPDDDEPPEFYKQFRKPEEIARKWSEAPYILSPGEVKAACFYDRISSGGCFWCRSFSRVQIVDLNLYCADETAVTPTRICERCRTLLDVGAQWVYCESCGSFTWEHAGTVSDKWERYFTEQPTGNIKRSQIVMTDHCPGCK